MADPATTTTHLLTLLTTHGQGDYIGEHISQLAHSLQTAHLASKSHASPCTIIAALLHDIGQFLPQVDAESLAGNVGRVGHEQIGARYLSDLGFGDRVFALVGGHVGAKRYLCAVESGYLESLSDASKASLELQGGPMSTKEVEEWEASELGREMAELRRWDDEAKVVGLEVPGVEAYRGMIEEHLRGMQSD